MPRRTRNSRPANRPTSRATAPPPQSPRSSTEAMPKDSALKNFSQNVLSGMSFGAGSSIAHHGVHAVLGNSQKGNQDAVSTSNVLPEESQLRRCLRENGGNIWPCQDILDQYTQAVMQEKD